MSCNYCKGNCQKAGKQKNGTLRLFCTSCKKYQQAVYRKVACQTGINQQIKDLLCEGVGIRGISRVLRIAIGTVLRRIKALAAGAARPAIVGAHLSPEVDELWTYVGRKANEYWIAYALDHQTRGVVDFIVGKRTKGTLKTLIDVLLAAHPKIIRTDNLPHYQRLIPKGLHRAGAYCINRIERKNLTIRTHLKRLSRRTIGFSRDVGMLENCLRIYFWR